MMNTTRSTKNVPVLLLGLLVAAVPFIFGSYMIHIITGIYIYIILAIGLGILTKTGQVSIGQASFFGLGAYASAVICKFTGSNIALELATAIIVPLIFSLLVGYVTLRLKGIYFSIATLAFTETLLVVAMMERKVMGGATGLAVPPLFKNNLFANYYLCLAILLVAFIIAYAAARSKIGFASTVIKNDERLANVIGINPTRYKIIAFCLSAAVSGMAGFFYVHYVTFIVPNEVFNMSISVAVLAMTIFGGAYSLIGPVIGALVLKIVEEFLRLNITYGHLIGYGVILIIGILFMPNGIVGLWNRFVRDRRHAQKRESNRNDT
jgi:branched-chain amino acid transport system permease protein